jgi:hypothetical protein
MLSYKGCVPYVSCMSSWVLSWQQPLKFAWPNFESLTNYIMFNLNHARAEVESEGVYIGGWSIKKALFTSRRDGQGESTSIQAAVTKKVTLAGSQIPLNMTMRM